MKAFILAVLLIVLLDGSTGLRVKRAHHKPRLTVSRLHGAYYDIFNPPNRNAASHLWVNHVLKSSKSLTKNEILNLFGAFCPVSGSPVTPAASNLYKGLKVGRASSNVNDTVNVHVCCWPCICDIQAFVKTDELTVKVKSEVGDDFEDHIFQVLVIGDPCSKPWKIPSSAPAVKCENGKLKDAVLSDNGHVVIGMSQPDDTYTMFTRDAANFKSDCDKRKASGYHSGMGKIFLRVAQISPII